MYTIIHISLIYLHIVHTDYYILVQRHRLFPRWLIKRTMYTTIQYILYTIHEHNHIYIKAHTFCMKYINTWYLWCFYPELITDQEEIAQK